MQCARQCLVVGKRVAKRAEEGPGIGDRLLGVHEALPLRHSPEISAVVSKKIGQGSDADMHANRDQASNSPSCRALRLTNTC